MLEDAFRMGVKKMIVAITKLDSVKWKGSYYQDINMSTKESLIKFYN